MSSRNTLRFTAMLVMAGVLACTESSRRPPTGPSSNTVFSLRLEIVGPSTVPLGQAVQFAAIRHLSDGTTEDVTARVSWFTSQPDVLSLSTPGLFTGIKSGGPSISAAFGSLRATMSDLIVVPEGTFRLRGTVRDGGVAVDALVRIENDALGRTDVQTIRGEYVVYGVKGEVRLTALKSGYHERTTTHVITEHERVDVELTLTRPRAEVAGNYRLSVIASDACSTLPEDVRVRSYDAVVEQSGPSLTVTLSGAQFLVESGRTLNRFKGLLEPDRAVFTLASPTDFYYYYFYTPDLFEVLAPGRNYVVDGTVVTPVTPNRLSGPLSGSIRVLSSRVSTSSVCKATDHGFVLER